MAGSTDSAIGRIIADRYEILEPLKEGGMGRVYVALQRSLNRKVALKLIRPGVGSMERATKRFLLEAKAASQLSHPNIVSIFDFGESEGQLFLVMELLVGSDLGVLLDSGVELPVVRTVDIVTQLLAGLADAHEQNISHRDVKPENIFLHSTRRGGDHVKLIDFGVARGERDEDGITLTGQIVGTPFYGAPEQMDGEPGTLADLYSVGVVLYEMLTGARPFDSESLVEVLILHRTAPRPDPRVRARTVIPAALAEVCMRAMAVDPKERFPDAEAMADALKAAAASKKPPPPPVVQVAAPALADFGRIDTIAPASSPVTPAAAPVSPARPGAKIVLVVEDDASVRTMLVRMLETMYTVYEAEDGVAAASLLERMPVPDVVVSDVMMPRMDGLSLARQLKAHPTLKSIPIIFLTARDEAKDVVAGIQAGARHYLTKPVKMKELLARVAKITGGE